MANSGSRIETQSKNAVRWRRVMRGRDPHETHRASTPLELLTDLCFAVAVSQAAAQLHLALDKWHLVAGLFGYLMVFFAIWWAWMNFTWFASAYDTDDAFYRALTLVQMAGVLVLAAGVPAAANDYNFTTITAGYVVMRIALVVQWLRAAKEHPAGRPPAIRYAAGVCIAQVGWLARLLLPHPLDYVGFVVLVVVEIAIPIWAERGDRATQWHPGHIVDRYGAFTIIVLGEIILGDLIGVKSAFTDHGPSMQLFLIAVGGLILVFALWWIYFSDEEANLSDRRVAFTWGYAHYFVFAAVAALGAGIEVAIDVIVHHSYIAEQTVALAVAVPVAVYLVALSALHRVAQNSSLRHQVPVFVAGIIVLLLAEDAHKLGVGGSVLGMGLVVVLTLVLKLSII